MTERTIEIAGVGKRYRLGEDFSHSRYRTLRKASFASLQPTRAGERRHSGRCAGST